MYGFIMIAGYFSSRWWIFNVIGCVLLEFVKFISETGAFLDRCDIP